MATVSDPGSRSEGVQVIARTAEILRALNGKSDGMSLSEISAEVAVPRSTVHRIVRALSQEGLVVPVGPTGGYRLGPEILRLASSERLMFRTELRPFLEQLSAATEETVDLGMLVRDQVHFVDQVVSSVHPLRAVSAVGQSFPAWSNAPGKALLAKLPDDELRKILPARLPRITENSITDVEELIAQLTEARKTGISYSLEENTEGICALGVAVQDDAGVALAIGIPVPVQRFRRNKEKLEKLLLKTARDIGRALPRNRAA